MKELTRIITAEITQICKISDDGIDVILDAESVAESALNYTADIERICHADDVHVKIQDFVMDEED